MLAYCNRKEADPRQQKECPRRKDLKCSGWIKSIDFNEGKPGMEPDVRLCGCSQSNWRCKVWCTFEVSCCSPLTHIYSCNKAKDLFDFVPCIFGNDHDPNPNPSPRACQKANTAESGFFNHALQLLLFCCRVSRRFKASVCILNTTLYILPPTHTDMSNVAFFLLLLFSLPPPAHLRIDLCLMISFSVCFSL